MDLKIDSTKIIKIRHKNYLSVNALKIMILYLKVQLIKQHINLIQD